ncbi:stage II sporulation protein P [uncultured Tyzzerella sp.]|uniref:stage II sporulation protein P n=1 Tax=uncultured Tyzzerella sp. TaxID=2321398 RepID=UPI0029430594|nr:stage II sporulation protein P [uncultured Tyzzerella sp.]
MDKKIEKFCEKVAVGIAISIILVIILFFNINEVAFGEIMLYDTLSGYKINEDVKDIFKKDDYIAVSNIENKENEEIGDIEILGLDDISYEHEKTDEEVEKSTQINSDNIDTDKLNDLDYLRQKFYVVDAKTGMSKDYFDVNKFINTDLKIEKSQSEPKVLIFHTHPHEMFKDSNENDINEGIVGVGTRLANLLEEEYGIKTLHITESSFDTINGRLQRNGAYERMEPVIQKVLEENPSIELVIDLHRDGVNENTRLVENINGKPTAKIMFFNGISRIMENGKLNNISNLPNPNIYTNLALSFNMQKEATEKYPGFTRKIYIKPYRYSLHLKPKTMLIEAGAQNNTKEEMYNAMEILAELINNVIFS